MRENKIGGINGKTRIKNNGTLNSNEYCLRDFYPMLKAIYTFINNSSYSMKLLEIYNNQYKDSEKEELNSFFSKSKSETDNLSADKLIKEYNNFIDNIDKALSDLEIGL